MLEILFTGEKIKISSAFLNSIRKLLGWIPYKHCLKDGVMILFVFFDFIPDLFGWNLTVKFEIFDFITVVLQFAFLLPCDFIIIEFTPFNQK